MWAWAWAWGVGRRGPSSTAWASPKHRAGSGRGSLLAVPSSILLTRNQIPRREPVYPGTGMAVQHALQVSSKAATALPQISLGNSPSPGMTSRPCGGHATREAEGRLGPCPRAHSVGEQTSPARLSGVPGPREPGLQGDGVAARQACSGSLRGTGRRQDGAQPACRSSGGCA